jgi:hypothetical protein
MKKRYRLTSGVEKELKHREVGRILWTVKRHGRALSGESRAENSQQIGPCKSRGEGTGMGQGLRSRHTKVDAPTVPSHPTSPRSLLAGEMLSECPVSFCQSVHHTLYCLCDHVTKVCFPLLDHRLMIMWPLNVCFPSLVPCLAGFWTHRRFLTNVCGR